MLLYMQSCLQNQVWLTYRRRGGAGDDRWGEKRPRLWRMTVYTDEERQSRSYEACFKKRQEAERN